MRSGIQLRYASSTLSKRSACCAKVSVMKATQVRIWTMATIMKAKIVESMDKTLKIFGVFAGLASLLVACQKEKLTDSNLTSEPEVVEMSVVADSDIETKTFIDDDGKTIKWGNDEALTVFEAATYTGGNSIVNRATSSVGESYGDEQMSFSVAFTKNDNASNFEYYAVYPAKALPANVKPTTKEALSNITVSLNDVQKPVVNSFATDADILIAWPLKGYAKQPDSALKFRFARVVAVGKLVIKNLDDESNISRIIITAEDNTNISGNTYFNLNNGRAKDGKYGSKNTITLDYSDESIAANGMTAYFTAWPFTIENDHTIIITVETDNYTFTKPVTIHKDGGFNFYEGKVSTLTINFDGITGDEKAPAPLPVDDETKTGIFVVGFDGNMMISGDIKNALPSKKIKAVTENGKVQIGEEDLASAWKFEFNPKSFTYKISSVLDPSNFIKGSTTGNSLSLTSADDATRFTVIKNSDETYNIKSGERYLGYNDNSQFVMLKNSTNLNIMPAVVMPVLKVESAVSIPGKASDGEGNVISTIPVSLYGGLDNLSTAVEYIEPAGESWIENVSFNQETSQIVITAKPNDETLRSAKIAVTGTGTGVTSVSKDVIVTQHVGGVYHASLDVSETALRTAKNNGSWGTYGTAYEYMQSNGATWVIDASTDAGINGIILSAADGSIQFPEFTNPVQTVKVTMQTSMTSGKKIVLSEVDNGPEIDSKTADGSLVYTFDLSKKEVTTAVLTATAAAKIKRIDVETRTPLSAPDTSSFQTDGKKLTWATVADAAEYDVTVGTIKATVKANSYDFTGEDEYYDVTVVAKADPASKLYIDSVPSKTVSLMFGNPQLNAPVLKEAGAKQHTLKVTWTVDERADGYTCEIAPAGSIKEQGNGVVEFEGLTADTEYTVTVKATSNGRYADSETSEIKVRTADIELEGDGSVGNPYSVKDVNAFETSHILNLTGKYVTGTVVEVKTLNDGKLTYTIKDTDKEGMPWPVTGKDLGDAEFSNVNELPVGKVVVIYYTDNTNNYLYSIDGKDYALTAIRISDAKTKYYYGKNFVAPAVYAMYRGNKTEENVTESCSFTGYDMNADGKHNVNVSYTEDGITRTATYTITVLSQCIMTYTHVFNRNTVSVKQAGYKDDPWTTNSDGIRTSLVRFIYKEKDVNNPALDYVLCKATTGNPNPSITTETVIPEAISKVEVNVRTIMTSGANSNLNVIQKGKVIETVSHSLNSSSKGILTYNITKPLENCTYELVFELNNGETLGLDTIVYTNEK